MTDLTDMPDDDRDGRPAEYVLGTLPLQDRPAFEAELARDPALRQAVAAWAARLQPLADSVGPVPPPPTLRQRVIEQITPPGAVGQRPFNIVRWLAWTFGLSAVAGAAAVAFVFLFTPKAPEIGGFAMLHRSDAKAHDVIAFEFDKQHQNMVVLVNAAGPGAGHDYELWVLPPHKAPVSLGLVKAGTREQRPLPPAVVADMTDFANLAVSVEPSGGSPSGAPTGPVVFQGFVRLMDKLTQ
jgi:anti-sigma-K factor RskA